MKIIKFLLNEIVAPLIVALLTPILIAIYSNFKTGNWKQSFYNIPFFIWLTISIIIILWIILITIKRRIKFISKNDNPSIRSFYNSRLERKSLGEINFAGVIWKVDAVLPDMWELQDNINFYAMDIDIEIPPRCPSCKTEIEEIRSFWGGYIWKCVRCGFNIRNSSSFYKEASRVEKIARRECEKKLNT